MKQIRYRDVTEEKYINAFLAPEGKTEDKHFVLELVRPGDSCSLCACTCSAPSPLLQTKNYGVESYDIGTGFGHFALRVPDVYETVKSIKEAGEQPQLSCRRQASAPAGLDPNRYCVQVATCQGTQGL